MKTFWIELLVILILSLGLAFLVSCGDDDDEPSFALTDSGDDDDDDSDDDDIVADDDDLVADDDDMIDDDDDDDVLPDDYVAPWPQSNVEVSDYDESDTPGPLRLKAADYDQFNLDWHQPFYGAIVNKAKFTDATHTELVSYGWWGDSTAWTGTYLMSQAMRYYVTGDPVAKANAIRSVDALSRHLHITGRKGFLSRYTAPQEEFIYDDEGGDAWCDSRASCHHFETGPNAGQWWEGETSRDMYICWLLGMATAYDLVDDADMRATILSDVTEVLEELIDHNWWIIDVDGLPSRTAPNLMGPQQLRFALVGYHLTGEDRYKEQIQKWILDSKRNTLRLINNSLLQQFGAYFPNNLRHQNQYSLLRLAKIYLGPSDYEFLVDCFETQSHTFARLSHNPFFNAIFMSQGLYNPEMNPDPYQDQLEEDLTDFFPAPLTEYAVDPPDGTLDPVSVFLADLITQQPFFEYIFGNIKPQSMDAHPVQQQCTTDFLWQRNPFVIEPCGTDRPHVTRAGVDYLVAYWMASYHKFIAKHD
jgi:hypothetical protein